MSFLGSQVRKSIKIVLKISKKDFLKSNGEGEPTSPAERRFIIRITLVMVNYGFRLRNGATLIKSPMGEEEIVNIQLKQFWLKRIQKL